MEEKVINEAKDELYGGNPAVMEDALEQMDNVRKLVKDRMKEADKEAKELALDKYNLSLGNVRALPYTLTKVGTFDINSKIFPFLEYYTCTDEEREMFETKIKWESMTVGKIDLCGQYFSQGGDLHYFKGELIRNEEIADDPHTFNAIYEELVKGVYI